MREGSANRVMTVSCGRKVARLNRKCADALGYRLRLQLLDRRPLSAFLPPLLQPERRIGVGYKRRSVETES